MDRKRMLQYLEMLAQLECQVYTLNQLQRRLGNQSKRLGHPKVFRAPEKNEKDRLSPKDILFELIWSLVWIAPFWFAVFLCKWGEKHDELLALYRSINQPKLNQPAVIWKIPEAVEAQAQAQIFFSTVTLAVIAAMVLCAWRVFRRHKEIVRANTHYREKVKEYESLVEADNLRVQKELQVKAELCAQRDAVLAEHQAAKNALDALYGLDIIDQEKRYRDFAAVTTFHGYFRKEYVDRLLGPGQAYDRYDEALKIGEIINKLDIIINKLDEIAKNQAYLAALLHDSNNTLRRIEHGNKKMLDSMERTEDNIELIEYNTRCAARSSEVTAMLTAFEVLRNHDE